MIKAGYLISYDYDFIKISLPRVYDYVDAIYFAVDEENKTWSGQTFEIDEEFWKWVQDFDKDGKIVIYKDRFYIPELTPMECDTRERMLLSEQMGVCNWYIQIDSDEYFIDFEAFINKLRHYKPQEPTSIYCAVGTLFKQIENGYLLIGGSSESLCFATNNPMYNLARENNSGNVHIYWEDLVLHQSWARNSEDIYWKLNNWSHKTDFNTESFYKLWNAIDGYNYYTLKDFHPLNPVTWPRLNFIEGSVNELLQQGPEIKKIVEPAIVEKRKSLLSRLWKEIKSS